jgi:hypothetical protein
MNPGLLSGLILALLMGCSKTGEKVIFPDLVGPAQITENGKENFWASYYGINSWSGDQRYVTVLETDLISCILILRIL